MFFPLHLYFLDDRVTLVKPGLFSQWERTIPLSKIACVSSKLNILTGTVRVESSGGVEDIVASGFNRADCEQFRTEVENAIA